MNPIWSWCILLFTCCWISLMEFGSGFSIYMLKGFWSVVFLWCPSLVLASGKYWLHRMIWEVFPLYLVFERVYEVLIDQLPINVGYNLIVKLSGHYFFFVGRQIINQIFLLVIFLFIFSILRSVLVVCVFLRIFPFHLSYLVCCI